MVESVSEADRLRSWFQEGWEGGGGLIVLPLDRVPDTSGNGGLLSRLEATGRGAPWVQALLSDIEMVEDADLLGESSTTR